MFYRAVHVNGNGVDFLRSGLCCGEGRSEKKVALIGYTQSKMCRILVFQGLGQSGKRAYRVVPEFGMETDYYTRYCRFTF